MLLTPERFNLNTYICRHTNRFERSPENKIEHYKRQISVKRKESDHK